MFLRLFHFGNKYDRVPRYLVDTEEGIPSKINRGETNNLSCQHGITY